MGLKRSSRKEVRESGRIGGLRSATGYAGRVSEDGVMGIYGLAN